MRKDIEEYCKSCDDCQRRGSPKRNNFLYPIKSSSLFDYWGIDLVRPLPFTVKRNHYIIVVTDYFTKWPKARPLKRADTQSVADFIYDKIICRFEPSGVIQSDQGSYFRNKVIQKLSERFRIKHKLSLLYHPQTNELVECFNKTLCEGIAKLCKTMNEWNKYI